MAERQHSENVIYKLLDREIGRERKACGYPSGRKFFSRIPSRLRIPIEDIIDEERVVLSCIILGFTRHGDYLLSYSCRSGKYHLQAWEFSLHSKLTLALTVPLFRGGEVHSFARVDDELAQFVGEDGQQDFRISICETTDSRFIVAHARVEDSLDRLSEGGNANFVSVIAHPRLMASSAGLVMDPRHVQYYNNSQNQTFDPHVSLLTDRMLLNDGSSIRLLSFALRSGDADADGASSSGGGSPGLLSGGAASDGESESGSFESSPSPPGPWRRGTLGASGPCSRVALTASDLFDAEQFIVTWLQRQLPGAGRLLDYDQHLLSLCCDDPSPHAVLLLACVLHQRAPGSDSASTSVGQASESSPRLWLWGLITQLEVSTGEADLLQAFPMQPPSDKWQAASLLARVPCYLQSVRDDLKIPTSQAMSPLVLTNSTVLDLGSSIGEIAHPLLPISVTGYRE